MGLVHYQLLKLITKWPLVIGSTYLYSLYSQVDVQVHLAILSLIIGVEKGKKRRVHLQVSFFLQSWNYSFYFLMSSCLLSGLVSCNGTCKHLLSTIHL